MASSIELRQVIRDLWANMPDVPEGPMEPIDRIAGGIRPVAVTVGAALTAIRRSLPVGGESRPNEPQAQHPAWNRAIQLS